MTALAGQVESDAASIVFLAHRQLWERRGLTLLAIAGVALGVFVLIVVKGIMAGFHDKFVSTVLSISPHAVISNERPDSVTPLVRAVTPGRQVVALSHRSSSRKSAQLKRSEAMVRAIRAVPFVTAAASSLSGNVLLESNAKSRAADLRGVRPAEQESVIDIEKYVTDGSFRRLRVDSSGVVLGKGIAEDLGVSVGDSVSAVSAGGGISKVLRVVGIYDCGVPSIDRSRVYVTLHSAQAILGRPDEVSRVELVLSDPSLAPRVARALQERFGYNAEAWQQANANFLSIFAMQNTMIVFVIVALLAVGGFGILSVQLMLVLQRQKEIAILRSVGFRRRDILRLFLLQGMVISLLGAVLGDFLGKVAVHYLQQVRMHIEGVVRSEHMLVVEEVRYYFYGLAFALVVGLLAALLPAWKAARVEPIAVLRGMSA